jgi:hypothetical protein
MALLVSGKMLTNAMEQWGSKQFSFFRETQRFTAVFMKDRNRNAS